MASKYGESFLTRPILVTTNERWVNESRFIFREENYRSGLRYWALSWLGVINGMPVLSRFFRLACTVEEDNTISGWKVIRWRW